MAEQATADTQQANSPARQLLAALTRASQEMEKAVQESYEHVTMLNSELERVLNLQLDQTSEKVEVFIHSHLDGLSSEKDAILHQLTELRQEELRVLQSTGRNLRQALVEKLDVLVTAFRADVDGHLQAFQDKLSQADKDNRDTVDATRQSLRERIPGFLVSVSEEVIKEKQGLEELHTSFQQTLTEESNVSLNQMVEHCGELKTRLETEGESFLASVDERAANLVNEQTEKLKQRIESFSQMEQKAEERIDSLSLADKSYIKDLPATFTETCGKMAELQVGLHATVVKNLALQYRTEILSAAQEAEDSLQIVRAELQSLLRQYQNHYAEQFENLLTKFEKSATDFANAQVATPELSSNREQIIEGINEKFNSLKKTVSESTREEISSTENAMEKSYEEFRLRLEIARKYSCENIEGSFKENQEELSKLQQSNEEQLKELSDKLDELEQSVNESKELIRALDQASLDF